MGGEGVIEGGKVVMDAESKEPQPSQSSLEKEDDGAGKEHAPRVSRKRTKTGCLTCRRRRIKCGEERPICANCIKSKRQCEGYNQRVIFKDPLNPYRNSSSIFTTHTPFSRITNSSASGTSNYNPFSPAQTASQASLPNILPKPPHDFQAERGLDDVSFSGVPGNIHQDVGQHAYTPSSHPRIAENPPPHLLDVHPNSFSYGQPLRNHHEPAQRDRPPVGFPTKTTVHYDFNAVVEHSSKVGMEATVESQHQWSNDGQAQFSLSAQSTQHLHMWNPEPNAMAPPDMSPADWAIERPQQESTINANDQRLSLQIIPGIPETYPKVQPTNNSTFWNSPLDNATTDQKVLPRQDQSFDHARERTTGAISTENVEHDTSRKQTVTYDQENEMMSARGPIDIPPLSSLTPSDDELYDVSDDDMELRDYVDDLDDDLDAMQQAHLKNNVGLALALQASQDSQDRKIRTYHSFIDGYGPEMLANYHPSSRNSPLNDSTTARIFCHFINVLGPSISMYERHPANPSLMFQGLPVPKSQQHIWSYTMPTLALSNPALLHAILALGSLHMAKLQNGPITASLKHYHISIRRVAKSISLPTRRGHPTTLATTLLLGFYEVMSADHNKWSNHLLGARHLMKEIDFASIARYIKTRRQLPPRLRHEAVVHQRKAFGGDDGGLTVESQISLQDEIDENLVSMIMGKKLSYDQYGQVIDESFALGEQYRSYTLRDLENYEIQSDLFWWFAKQDAFQSILGGNRLFLDYELWSHCPPRAPIGRRDAVYGTFDHLILLLGRLADFAARDLKRKRGVMRANGGQWRPPPGFPMPGPPRTGSERKGVPPGMPMPVPPTGMSEETGPQGAPGLRNGGPPSGRLGEGKTRGGPPQMPSFAGMLPTEKPTLPRGFSPSREASPQSEEGDIPLEDQTKAAEDEWHEIRSAFNVLGDHFGPDFQALGPEYSQPINTPFGPALQYRTYSIAGIWMAYYLGLIVCHRAHPSMPPAAMMAAGLTAKQTAFFANEICRIAGGISPDVSTAEFVNISVGAGLMESSFGLFVAGVQMQDPSQRKWIIQRLLDIERLTGWQTASQVAKGCELSWIKAAENGVGPPYTRATFNEAMPVGKIWQSAGRRIEGMMVETAEESNLAMVETRRVRHAYGLLGVEEDLDELDLNQKETDNR